MVDEPAVADEALGIPRLSVHTLVLEQPSAWQITIFSEPLGDLGGDFYGITTAEARHDLVVGDVCGKGPDAARFVYPIVANLKGPRALGPSERLAHCNAALAPWLDKEFFCTAWCGALYADGTVLYASAGHEPPLLRCRDGRVRELPFGGLPIGVADDVAGDEHAIFMQPGDRLLIYTDGLTECFDRGCVSAQEVFDDFLGVQATVRSCRRSDDVLALLVERCPINPRSRFRVVHPPRR